MNFLDWLEVLESLDEKDKENLAMFCQEKHIKKGEVLFKEHEDANAMYILKTWKFNITKNIWWKDISIWTVKAEEILGEMALFTDKSKRMATATALEDSILITILSFSIKELTSKYPELFLKIQNIIDERVIANKLNNVK